MTDSEPPELETVYDAAMYGEDEPGDYDLVARAVDVKVDRETGAPSTRDSVLAADVGAVINPVAYQGTSRAVSCSVSSRRH